MNRYVPSREWWGPIGIAGIALGLFDYASALTTIGMQLDFGARGDDVISLQQFLATDASVYPEGLVTGYFGVLTQAAVQRFQCKQNIVCSGDVASSGYGRVGPRTLAALNAMIGGGMSTVADVSAPIVSGVVVSTATSSATVTWVTNEPAQGTVYWGLSTLPALEASAVTGVVIGGSAVGESTFITSHSVTLTGLARNTLYFYTVKSVDASGNVQLTWPSFFRTNP